jgi:prepilin-type N-terminal cleavage/methylation domain-containing protein/prepilin-type processing-associated H-X9-DG protein
VKRAFTLIELLVVIAIIAILAAILFPVFAQAKLQAKKTASLSNIKQHDLASLMYMNDADDNIPIFVNCQGTLLQCQAAGGGWGALVAGNPRADSWVWEVQPYVKNLQLMVDPMTTDGDSIFGSGIYAWWRNQDIFPYYGINYLFLSPWDGQCANAAGSKSGSGASQPSNTVFFTQSWDFGPTATIGYFTATAPGMYPVILPSPNYCIWSGAGWSKFPAGGGPSKTAEIAYRNGQGSNVAWLDGHAKYQTIDALAAGTDFATQTNPLATKIVDITKYEWSYDGTIPQ